MIDLWMVYSILLFWLFLMLMGFWSNLTGLSSGYTWAMFVICKLVPPWRKTLFSSISLQACMIISQDWCLDLCFHGQWLRLRHCNSYHIFPVCKLGAAITKKYVLVIFFASTQHNVIKIVSKPIFAWSMINIKAFTTLSNVHMYLIWYNCEYGDSQNILYFHYNFRGFITRCPTMRLDVSITHLPNVWATRGIQYTEFHTERGWVTVLGRSTSWLGLRDPRHDSWLSCISLAI